jgi:hypothetical protein
VDFIADVLGEHGIEDGYTTNWNDSEGRSIKVETFDGTEYLIEFLSWDDEEIIIMEYDFFIKQPHGYVKITKDS